MADETKTNTTATATESKAAPAAAPAKAAAVPAQPVPNAAPEEGPKSSTDGADRTVSSETADIRRATQGLTEALADEYAAAGVNPALDNRIGDQRPSARGMRVTPQQFPGPEVGHFAEHEAELGDAFRAEFEADGEAAPVAKSTGPHGRGTDQ